METEKGYELRLEKEGLEDYALLFLNLSNLKHIENIGIVDVCTVEATDYIVVICHKDGVQHVKDVASRHGATVEAVEETILIEIDTEDFSKPLQQKVDSLLEDANMPSFYVNNTFTKGY